MKDSLVDYEDRDPTREQARRLVDDAVRTLAPAEGPHLNDEEFHRLITGTLSAASRVMAHVEACPQCARAAALQELEVLSRPTDGEIDPQARYAGSSLLERDAWLQVDLPVAAFASAGGLTDGLLTRALSWQASKSDPALLCALDDENAPARQRFVFRARTSSVEWRARPLRFVIQDSVTGAVVADSWIVLHANPRNATESIGEAVVAATPPLAWVAWVTGYVFVRSSPPGYGEVEHLRGIIGASSERDRAVWRAWLDREAAEGRLSERVRAELLAGA